MDSSCALFLCKPTSILTRVEVSKSIEISRPKDRNVPVYSCELKRQKKYLYINLEKGSVYSNIRFASKPLPNFFKIILCTRLGVKLLSSRNSANKLQQNCANLNLTLPETLGRRKHQ